MCAVKSTGCRGFPSMRVGCCCGAFVVSAGGIGAFHGGILGRATLGVPGFDLELSAIFHAKGCCRILPMHKLSNYFLEPNPACPTTQLSAILGSSDTNEYQKTARHGRSQPISRLPASLTGRLLFGCSWQGFKVSFGLLSVYGGPCVSRDRFQFSPVWIMTPTTSKIVGRTIFALFICRDHLGKIQIVG